MQVLRITPEHPLRCALADYADGCGWIAGPHVAAMVRENRFSGWEAIFAAVAEGRIIGFCTLLKTDYYPENRYSPWVSSIFVDEGFRRRRVCGQLIAQACDYARDCGFSAVYIPSDMTGFYERFGFRKIDELTNYGGDVDNVFTRELPPAGAVRLVRATEEDAELIHRMKHDAFWPLYQRYHDDATSPALELLSKVKGQLAHPATDWYLIRRGSDTCGAMRIVRTGHPSPQGRVLATLGDCKQSLSLVGQEPDLTGTGHPSPQGRVLATLGDCKQSPSLVGQEPDLTERTEPGASCCRISPLFVLPEYQGQGLAQAAILAAFSLYPEAAQWHLSTILQEHGNCHLYEKLCFRCTMTEPTAYPGMDFAYYTRLREDVPLRRLARLTDRELLGTEAVSHAAPRLTARAIVRGPQGLYAVTHTEGFGIYMLPGGGVDGDESILTALHREVREETGCRIESAVPLGYVEENRGHADYTQLSYYFVVTTQDVELRPELTELEAAHGTTVQWMTLEDMWKNISTPVFERPQGKFLQARDVAALRAYMANG